METILVNLKNSRVLLCQQGNVEVSCVVSQDLTFFTENATESMGAIPCLKLHLVGDQRCQQPQHSDLKKQRTGFFIPQTFCTFLEVLYLWLPSEALHAGLFNAGWHCQNQCRFCLGSLVNWQALTKKQDLPELIFIWMS